MAEPLQRALSAHKSALDYAREMVGKTPNDADLRAYLRGEHLDPRKHDWCAAFVNASLYKAGIEGSGSQMATGFLNWGKHVEQKDVKAGDILVLGAGLGGEWVKPQPGMHGHSAIVAGPPVKREGVELWDQPVVMGAWQHHSIEDTLQLEEGEYEYRRPPPSHRAQKVMLTVHLHAKIK